MFKLTLETTTVILTMLSYFHINIEARAIMVEPPHRSSLWRFNYNTTVNLRDDTINCGGYDWQWGVHGGRCGVCGDMWNGRQDNDDNGKFATGIIVRSYLEGHYINVTFEVSSNYLGYVEFRLCSRNSTATKLDQSCFDRYPLWIDESHGTRYHIGSRGGIYDIHIRLPGDLVCKKCVLQWKYKTGYRYNGESQCKCLGCGKQEQYVNCADIEIQPHGGWSQISPISNTTQTPSSPNLTSGPIDLLSHGRAPFSSHTGPSFDARAPSVDHRSKSTVVEQRLTSAHTRQFGTGSPWVERRVNTSTVQPTSPLQFTRVTNGHVPVINNIGASQVAVTSLSVPVQAATGNDSTAPVSRITTLPVKTHITSTAKPSLDTLPSYLLPSSLTPSSTSSVTSSVTSVLPNTTFTVNMTGNTITLDNIRKEIVTQLGKEVNGGIKVLFSPPAETVKPSTTEKPTFTKRVQINARPFGRSAGNVVRRPPPIFRTFTERPVKTDVPNTQFVSVSNILNRFYPNYVSPLLYSLTRPRANGMNIGPGCDVNSDEFRCKARGIYNHISGISRWCEINCRASNCVNYICECGCEDTSRRRAQNSSCHAIANFHGVEGMDEWCTANCKVGYCPANTCSIEDCIR